jgi:Flp pilus assembly protein TadG
MRKRRHDDRLDYFRLHQFASTEASQLLEFAVALPLLVVLVVGIFDFGEAFNLKHQLRNAVREGARLASSLPLSDITSAGTPSSVLRAWNQVDAYLLRSEINDCGLGAVSAGPTGSGSSTWTSTTTNAGGCLGALTFTIERAYVVKSNSTDVICTRVSINYPFQWHFNRVIQLLVGGSTYGPTIQIAADALMPNME